MSQYNDAPPPFPGQPTGHPASEERLADHLAARGHTLQR